MAQFSGQGSIAPTAVPITSFTLQAIDPSTGIDSGSVPGSFVSGNSAVQQDIVLNGAGVLSGTVTDSNGQPVNSGTVDIELQTHGAPADPVVPIKGDGTFSVADLKSGTYGLTASVPTSQGGPPLRRQHTCDGFGRPEHNCKYFGSSTWHRDRNGIRR